MPSDAVLIHARVEPAEVDEDHDVRHVEAVADAAVEGERAAAQHGVQRIARAGGGDRGKNGAGEAGGEGGIEKCSAAGDGACGDEADGHCGESDREPDAAAERQRVEAEREQAAHGDSVDVRERVGRRDPGEVREAEER